MSAIGTYSTEDKLAVIYMAGDTEIRDRITQDIERMPCTRLMVAVIVALAILIFLLGGINYCLYELTLLGWKINKPAWFLIDAFGIMGLFKTYLVFSISRPSVYDLILRFKVRHPSSPFLHRSRRQLLRKSYQYRTC